MAGAGEVCFMKTHKRRKGDGHPAIYLVRDGRDAVVSHARLRAAGDGRATFEQALREEITRPFIDGQPSSGSWGGNVLSWLETGGVPTALLRYEELIVRPHEAVERAVSSLVPGLAALPDARIPTFEELRRIDPAFFRRGTCGSFRDEMPEALHELFWAQPENAAAMRCLGYDQGRPGI